MFSMFFILCFFVFFKQKTAYEMRISDWSSDVCSSDLITGTLNLLEEAVDAGVGAFVFTSTTSVFGNALTPPAGAPAAWVTEEVAPIPKNLYGVTQAAAEDLCQLFHRRFGLPVVVLRPSRLFPDPDDRRALRERYADANVKANELLFRRLDRSEEHTSALQSLMRISSAVFCL